MNSCKLKNYSSDQKRMVAVHEMGHAHGLGDHYSTDGVSASGTVMWNCSTCSGKTAPTAHDKTDYDALWP